MFGQFFLKFKYSISRFFLKTEVDYFCFPVLTQSSEFALNKIKMKILRDKKFEEKEGFVQILSTFRLLNDFAFWFTQGNKGF